MEERRKHKRLDLEVMVELERLDEESVTTLKYVYVRYGCFLLKNYFPIHDDACFEEGRLMKQAIYGTEDEKQDAVNTLTVMNGRMKKMLKKYFAF